MSKKGIYYDIPEGFKYSFASDIKIKPVISEERDKYLALASSENLKKFLPSNINLKKNTDLLCWAGNFCVVNKINLNDDVVSNEEAAQIVELLPYKFCDFEHDRSILLGCILTAGYSEYGTDRVLTAEEVKTLTGPYNITTGGILWKAANPELVGKIEQMGEPDSKESPRASWELAFYSFDLVSIDKNKTNIEDGQIISSEAEINKYEKYLRSFGGTGFNDEGKRIARLVRGELLPLGVGFVANPAGQVGDIIIQSSKNMDMMDKEYGMCPECGEDSPDGTMDNDDEITCGSCKKISKAENWKKQSNSAQNEQSSLKNESLLDSKNDYSSKELTIEEKLAEISQCLKNINKSLNLSENDLECVAELLLDKKSKQDLVDTLTEIAASKNIISQNNKINVKETMNINKVEDITTESLKEITASQIQDFIQKKCAEISENWVNEKKAKDEELKAFTESKKTLDETVTSLNTKLAEVTKSLETIQAEAAEKAKIELYNQRMAHIESIYELDPEITKIVASDLKDIDEEGFKKVEEKYKVLFKDKNRAEIEAAKKKKMEKEKEDSKDDKKDDKKEDKKDGEDKKLPPWLDKKKAKASVEDAVNNSEKEKINVPNTTSTETPTLLERAKKAFGKENVKIDCSRRRKI